MAGAVPLGIRTHSQRVCNLYKRALRNLEAFYDRRNVYRYQAVLLRERFDKHAKETDLRKAVQLLKEGEEELPGGVAFEREVEPPDWVLDYWHPLEKAEYPEYFKKREQRKKEFIAMWEKQYGKHEDKGHH
ncbi:hypothetical protein MSG28_013758 [Choristoneura fumiferana]|uniref:Uncharacterized protein n=1 Tax=Choristoneura fumiferana TaxID=7141 RepID=A0ACC0K9A9_CHOFU|nr:hypothetical protein MSG28_013758 [Choristoneura fumiferana]